VATTTSACGLHRGWRTAAGSAHFLVAELALYLGGQDALDEDVLLQHYSLTCRGAKTLKHLTNLVGEFRPRHRGDDGFHERDALHAVAVLVGPVEAEY
jgi:hypothetical protein